MFLLLLSCFLLPLFACLHRFSRDKINRKKKIRKKKRGKIRQSPHKNQANFPDFRAPAKATNQKTLLLTINVRLQRKSPEQGSTP